MKRFIAILLVILLLVGLVACEHKDSIDQAQTTEGPAASIDPKAETSVLRTVGGYDVVANEDQRKDEYPYMLQTENSVWYIAQADVEKMGEEAFYAGLEDILQYLEDDMADARAALAGRIWAEVPPVEIRTDFCGKAGAAQDSGAYYNGRVNFIKLFSSWDMAKFALLHEYVHYLTIHCADRKTMFGFYNETVAEYVSKLCCENRMFRSVDLSKTEQPELSSMAQIWGDFDEVKYRNSCFSESDAYARGMYDGMGYLCVGQYTTYRWANKRLPDHLYELSYAEAVSVALYLMDSYGAEKFLDSWDVTDEDELAARFGFTLSDLLLTWSAWNADQCAALGLRTDQP